MFIRKSHDWNHDNGPTLHWSCDDDQTPTGVRLPWEEQPTTTKVARRRPVPEKRDDAPVKKTTYQACGINKIIAEEHGQLTSL